MLVSKKGIDNLGGMPEACFLWYEELNWCNEIIRVVPDLNFFTASRASHIVSLTMKKSLTKSDCMARNQSLLILQTFSGLLSYCSLFFVLFVVIPNNLCRFLVRPKWVLLA